ncbi:hypothetical protein DFP72DRAFT_1073327 [Ephemerocybe angulata]|uniref:Uncharacterized protein n=1 Tax=Ephemerocybe angulata TaxID=980116 RepID=A0A8H6M0W4_9AGAR|nr:hypothetical protein DFP72DRAFT_1073327 [Tulosesus angulatus]
MFQDGVPPTPDTELPVEITDAIPACAREIYEMLKNEITIETFADLISTKAILNPGLKYSKTAATLLVQIIQLLKESPNGEGSLDNTGESPIVSSLMNHLANNILASLSVEDQIPGCFIFYLGLVNESLIDGEKFYRTINPVHRQRMMYSVLEKGDIYSDLSQGFSELDKFLKDLMSSLKEAASKAEVRHGISEPAET